MGRVAILFTEQGSQKVELGQPLYDHNLVLQEEVARLMPLGECPIWSPYDAFEAADVMQQFLDRKKDGTLSNHLTAGELLINPTE